MIFNLNGQSRKYYFLSLLTLLITNILFQLVVILKLSNDSIYFLIGYDFVLLLIILYKEYIKDLITFLLIVNFVPLLYLNNEFHYRFEYEVLTAFPLFLIVMLMIFQYTYSTKNLSFRLTYLQKPIVLIVIYFSIHAAIDIINGQDTKWILLQLFQIYLYLLILPICYFLVKREYYMAVFYALLFISVVISFEYIVFNQIVLNYRFVTFQSGFLPLLSGVLFSYILFNKDIIKRIVGLILLIIVTAGAFVTLTRTLWVTTFIVLFFVWIFYVISTNKLTLLKLIMVILIISASVIFLSDVNKSTGKELPRKEVVESRAKSVANPLEDSSFLMRVEFTYYAVQRFIESPIVGKGLGDYLRYKIFNTNKSANYFIDNSWVYFLWKGGLIAFLLFAWLYIRFFKASYTVLKNTSDIRVKYVTLGLLAGFLGLTFLGLLSPLLIKYKSNVIIAFIFAYIEFERMKIMNEKSI
jgi:O-Antigen ligase